MNKKLTWLIPLVIVVCLALVFLFGWLLRNRDKEAAESSSSDSSEVTESTERELSELESALKQYDDSSQVPIVKYQDIEVSYLDQTLKVTPTSELSSLAVLFTVGEGDESKLEYGDPEVIDVAERLSYEYRERNDSDEVESRWRFLADSEKESNALKWIELSPCSDYNDGTTPKLNGIGLTSTLEDVYKTWGTPTSASVTLKGGRDVIVLSYEYDMPADGYSVCAYVYFSDFDSTDFDSAPVYDICFNMMYKTLS